MVTGPGKSLLAVLAVAAALVVYGVALLAPAAAFIVGGLLLAVLGILALADDGRPPAPPEADR